jgi:hypothetical integral membrane protein (TIGR02206 family)
MGDILPVRAATLDKDATLPPTTLPGFQAFSLTHFLTLLSIAAVAAALVACSTWRRLALKGDAVARALGLFLLANELTWFGYSLTHYGFRVQESVPLHLCDVTMMASIVALLTRRQLFYEFAYFYGLGGTVQALITPELQQGFPAYTFFKFFISHGGIIVGVVFMTWVLRLRPTLRSIPRMIVAGNLYMLLAGLFDFLTGTNYGYLCHKPITPSFLDFLGPWPWYLLSIELIGIALILVFSVPFVLADRMARSKSA